MKNNNISVGMILRDTQLDIRYRLIYLHKQSVVMCEMDVERLKLNEYELTTLLDLLSNGRLKPETEETIVFDKDTLSANIREKFDNKKQMMNKLASLYGPSYVGLIGRKQKPDVKALMEEYGYSHTAFWKTCAKYFQSGMQDYSLVDAKAFGVNKGKEYELTAKPGRVSETSQAGVVLTDEIRGYFDEAIADYKKGRQKTFQNCFDYMNTRRFMEVRMINGVSTLVLKPETERPTFWQFYRYASKHLTKQEIDKIKTSSREQYNNKRLTTSDSLYGVNGPGDLVEIDACEVDISLVSMLDKNQTVGRPIVYFMIDVYSRIILAVSIAFDNNSILGLTNLFLNLADDKQEFCQRFGMGFDNPALWPSNIIPKRVRVDRGSEFVGKEFDRICTELNIEKIVVPPASGSMKGVVEQAFHQLHQKQNVHVENKGLIEKRYDSHHHTESTLNIAEYTRMVINFVLSHNQQSLATYPSTKDMLEKGLMPIPALLWEYGVDKFGPPRVITNHEQYLFNLMIPVKAKVSRRGISYKDLWYLPESDPQLSHEMFNAGKKKISFEVRMDMRDISNVYYLRGNKMIVAPLNQRLNGNDDYRGLTMKQYEDYRKKRKNLIAAGQSHNQELNAFTYAVNETVVNEAKKSTPSTKKNLRAAREQEKQLVSSANKISKRIPDALPEPEVVEAIEEPKKTTKPKNNSKEYANFDEALDDLWDE